MPSLPNILMIGPQKAGTSWAHAYLRARGDVGLPKGVKETFFYDRRFSKGLGWYEKHFSIGKNHDRITEVAPTYFECPEAPNRIHQTLGQIQIVCSFRDPANRTFSLYQHFRRYGMLKCSNFREAVESSQVLSGSYYAQRLKTWQATFGEKNVSTLFMEDLATTPDDYVRQLCSLYDLPYQPIPPELQGVLFGAAESPNFYVAAAATKIGDALRSLRLYPIIEAAKKAGLKSMVFGKPKPNTQREKLSPEDREWLINDFLLNDINDLESMLGRDLSQWKSVT